MIELVGKIPEIVFGAVISTPIASGLTLAGLRFKHRVLDVRSMRSVFGFIAEPTHVFLPLNSPFDGGAASGYGDLLALTELIAVSEKLHQRRSQISVHPGHPKFKPFATLKSQHIISIGGYKHNGMYRELIDHLRPPFHFCHKDQRGSREIRNEDQTVIFQSRRDEKGALVYDIGLALRAPNPFNPDAVVLMVAGAHSYGSIAAMKYLCNPDTARDMPSQKGQRAMMVVACDVDQHHIGRVRRVSDVVQW